MNSLRRRWLIDKILVRLKKWNIVYFSLSILYKYYYFIENFFRSKENKSFYFKHKGEICYILGNGISLYNLKVSELKKGKVFACNEIFYHKEFNALKIDYYTIIEPYYGPLLGKNYIEDTLSLYSDVDKWFCNKKVTMFFHPSLRPFFIKYKLLKNQTTRFVAGINTRYKKKASNNMAGIFNFSQGALSFMIAASIYMGFKKIVLLGCGYTYNPRQEYHFYAHPYYLKSIYDYDSMLHEVKEFSEKAGVLIKEIQEKDDRYVPIFVSPFLNDQLANRYKQLKKFAESNNVEIINIHPNDYNSPIFTGLTWKQYREKQNNN